MPRVCQIPENFLHTQRAALHFPRHCSAVSMMPLSLVTRKAHDRAPAARGKVSRIDLPEKKLQLRGLILVPCKFD
jgi:hypothetical protein